MSTILTFTPGSQAVRAHGLPEAGAAIIIFPGVRREILDGAADEDGPPPTRRKKALPKG